MHFLRTLRAFAVVAVVAASGFATTSSPAAAAPGDGPAPCSSGAPPSPAHGYCGTYNGRNSWYGTYGPGFPGSLGWVLCVNDPNHAGSYPHPGYAYVATTAPAGMNGTRVPALGFAFSEAQARGWVTNGIAGQFSANQLAAAMRIEVLVRLWNEPLPSMDAGLTRAYRALDDLVVAAIGASGTPAITLTVTGDPTIATAATLTGTLRFPGSGAALAGTTVTLSASGATFLRAGGPSTTTVTTSATGAFSVAVVNVGGGPHTIRLSASAKVGQRGLTFLGPTLHVLNAQTVAAPLGPTTVAKTLSIDAGPQTGAIAIAKSVDDGAWVSAAGAEFSVLDGNGQVVAALTTDAAGLAGPTDQLPVGTYTVHEDTPPWGYEPAADQTVVVSAGLTTTVAYEGPTLEHVVRATLGLRKVDAVTGVGLPGATMTVAYDADATGTFSTPIGTCTTDVHGDCTLPDSANLLPGDYLVTETAAPPGYLLPEPNTEVVRLIPGEARVVTFADVARTTELSVHKTNASEPGTGVPGAVYDLYSVDPGPLGGPVAAPPDDAASLPGLTWYARGETDHDGVLTFTVPVGSAWCVREHSTPSGFTLDGALRCTAGPLDGPRSVVAVAETVHTVVLAVHKYDVANPGTGIPGAAYDLFVVGSVPVGFTAPPVPAGVVVPDGLAYFGTGVTATDGALAFHLPAGHRWCVAERTAPPDYLLDPALRCTTGPLLGTDPATPTTLAAPERHVPELPMTGANLGGLVGLGLVSLLCGAAVLARRRRKA